MPESVWPTGSRDHGNQPPKRLEGKLQRLFHGDESSGAQAFGKQPGVSPAMAPKNCLKPLCNVNVLLLEVKRSSRACSTCEASNGTSTENIRGHSGPLELQPDTWHRKQQSAVGRSWRDRMSRGYTDVLSLLRERVESTTQSDQSGILTVTSHSSHQKHKGLGFQSSWLDFKAISSNCVHARRKATVVRTPMVRLQWLDLCGRTRLQCCTLGALLLDLGWALLEKPQHPIREIQASIKRDRTVKMKSNDGFSETSASCPGRTSLHADKQVIFKHPWMSLWEKYTDTQRWRFGSFVTADCKQALLQKGRLYKLLQKSTFALRHNCKYTPESQYWANPILLFSRHKKVFLTSDKMTLEDSFSSW